MVHNITVKGLEDQIFQIACQWWSMEKRIAGIPAGIPGAGEKAKLPVIKGKDGSYFLLFYFSPRLTCFFSLLQVSEVLLTFQEILRM